MKIGILGYGNLGRGVECAIKQNPDMELAAVFTRRAPETVSILTEGAAVCSVDDVEQWKDKIDVMILCGGSATDLPEGRDYTFWGKGVSQGHSDAIRRVEGVKDGKQYTIPVEAALEAVRNGENPELTTRQKHTRECFVVLEDGADAAKVEETIKNMPNDFSDYDTTVHFISEEELKANHSGIPHGGFVIRSGKTGWNQENSHVIEYSLKLDSTPDFTSCVIVAYARAAYRLYKEGQNGCKTVFDIAPAYLSAKDGAELRKNLL